MAKKAIPILSDGAIQVPLKQAEIDASIERHRHALVNLIRDTMHPPADGAIIGIMDAIHALQTRVIASDDKAGRGTNEEDIDA